jgi:glycosyltransferase involved in cell wall biosynthesis
MSQEQSTLPLVAIVTPVYNGAKYLAETMECVQSQDYSNLIHIVLDNASADATPKIISAYRNSRVPILTTRNKTTIPLVANFNAVVTMVPAEAAYFRLLCADDLMAPNAISRQVEVAERDPQIGIVGCECRVLICGLSDGYNQAWSPHNGLPKDQDIFDGREVIRGDFAGQHWALGGTQVLIRRSKINERPVFYDTMFHAVADLEANIRICVNNKFGFVHDELATWRQHGHRHTTAVLQSGYDALERLMLLDRYGRLVWNDREYRRFRASWRRYYLRQLLLMRWRDGDKATFKEHMAILKQNKDPASWLDFADALAEWGMRCLTQPLRLCELTRGR